jgi:hypothetical protein
MDRRHHPRRHDGPAAFRAGDNPDGYPPGAHYRNYWWVRDPGVAFYFASGINGQHVFIHVPSQTVVVKLSTWPAPWREDWLKLTVRGVTAVTAALQEGPAQPRQGPKAGSTGA